MGDKTAYRNIQLCLFAMCRTSAKSYIHGTMYCIKNLWKQNVNSGRSWSQGYKANENTMDHVSSVSWELCQYDTLFFWLFKIVVNMGHEFSK